MILTLQDRGRYHIEISWTGQIGRSRLDWAEWFLYDNGLYNEFA